MAEAVGFVVGVAAFAHQITTQIHTLRSIRKFNRHKAPAEVRQLWDEFEYLEHITSVLQKYDFPADWDPPLTNSLKEIGNRIHQLSQKAARGQTGRWDRLKSGFSRDTKEEIVELSEKIGRLRSGFNLSVTVLSFLQHRSCPVPAQSNNIGSGPSAVGLLEDSSLTSAGVEQPTIGPQERCLVSEPDQTLTRRITRFTPPSCGIRLCHCSCHVDGKLSGRVWYLQYTPISVLFRNCDNPWCEATRVQLAARLSLWKLGVPWAISGGFEFLANNGSYTLRPALSIRSVVPYTAPVFETLWYLEYGQITLSQAKKKLAELKQADRSIASHVNPSGEDCIQFLLCHGSWARQDWQFEILLFLTGELRASLKDKDERFLIDCAMWMGEGRHLDLLDCILRGGFDPSLINSPIFEQWPVGCSSNWICEEVTPDPFFVEYLAMITRNDKDFSGVHQVHQVVLRGSVNCLQDFVSRFTSPLADAHTFLGQTPLHLAVDNVELVRILLKAGHEIDVADKWGVTPLMYASARGCTDTAGLLISGGANLITTSGIENRDFLAFAILRGNLTLAIQALEKIKSIYGRKTFESLSLRALMILLAKPEWGLTSWEACFDILVRNCGNVNYTFGDQFYGTELNNLMFYVRSTSAAKTLIQLGYDSFSRANSKGELAIHTLAKTGNADILRICFENGADVDHQDEENCTVLLKCVAELGSQSLWGIIESIKACLEHEADIFVTDKCQCACAPEGCSITSAFSISFDWTPSGRVGLVWTLEWLSLVQEYRGTEALRRTLLQFLRRAGAEDIGVTHLCCHRGRGTGYAASSLLEERSLIPPEDALEILEEEEELVLALEETVPFASETVDQLTTRWICFLANSHKNHLRECQKKQENLIPCRNTSDKKDGYRVDHKRDEYQYPDLLRDGIDMTLDTGEMERQAVCYGLWMEHELSKRKADPMSISGGERWYERRRSLLAALLSAAGVTEEEIARRMEMDYITGIGTEKPDRAACARNFLGIARDAKNT